MDSLKIAFRASAVVWSTCPSSFLIEHYDKYVSQSVDMNVQAEFDMLVHSITLRINEVFKEAADRAEAEQPGTSPRLPV